MCVCVCVCVSARKGKWKSIFNRLVMVFLRWWRISLDLFLFRLPFIPFLYIPFLSSSSSSISLPLFLSSPFTFLSSPVRHFLSSSLPLVHFPILFFTEPSTAQGYGKGAEHPRRRWGVEWEGVRTGGSPRAPSPHWGSIGNVWGDGESVGVGTRIS